MKKIIAIFIGFASTFFVMTIFEFANSLFHPFPANIDTKNLDAVREFSQTLPTIAFVVVLLGWAAGSFVGGFVLTRYTIKNNISETKVLISVLGVILTIFGCVNNFIFLPGIHPVWFNIIGLPLFIIFTRLGYMVVKNNFHKK